jgi:very-short-patch-repair endonuclease
VRIADIAPPQITSIHGVAITTPLRTGIDVARDLGRCRTSALLPLCGSTRAELAWFLGGEVPAGAREVTNRLQQNPLIRADLFAVLGALVNESLGYRMKWARQVLCDVEPLLETALEGLAWSVLTDTDLPRPVPQRWLRGASGRSYPVDFLIGGAVIVEADGAGKYATETPWQEKQRQHDLEAAGFWVVRCTREELITRPHEVIARVRFALSRLAR